MDAIRNILTLQLGLFLSFGIGTASLFPEYLFLAVSILAICLGYALFSLFFLYKNAKLRLGVRSIMFLCTFLIGYTLYVIHLPQNKSNHIENIYTKNKKDLVFIEVAENLRSTNYYHQYIAKVKQINQQQSHGKILVRMRRQDSLQPFEPGMEKLVYTNIQTLAQPVNPFDVDMRHYYKSLDVFHRVTLTEDAIVKKLPSSTKLSWTLRKKALHTLEQTTLQESSKQLIQAMVLGYRDEWSTDRRTQYSNAGVAHILAISGLHIGLLYLVLFWLALPLQRISYSRIPVYLFCLIGLWAYAWFTGMSPSATRSVSMLSFFILAKLWARPAPSLHILGSSYIVLLLIKPEWLFHIGFQMSYTAVFFILWLYPKAIAYWEPRNILLKRIWQIVLISCIAQLGVLPWSLHYFGKIPGLFLVSNLIIFSVLSVLLIGGMLILLLSAFKVYGGWHLLVYDFLVTQIDRYVLWVSNQESWILSVSKPNMAISIGIFSLLLFSLPIFWRRGYHSLRNLSVVGMFFLSIVTISKLLHTKEEVWLLQDFGESLILQIHPTQITLFTNNPEVEATYLWARLSDVYAHREIHTQELPRLFKLGQQTYLQVDSTAVYPDSVPEGSIVILQQSSRINLDKLLNDVSPKLLIADGSNYPSSVRRWQETCIKTKTPLIYTADKGAILLGTSPFIFEKYLRKTSDSLAKIAQR
ncbi:MAG TPA: ComEC/Rec2 family competence protein [Flavobacteriaceae bacterium]|nr:ComEC/Rec2 family competence protein [Flavobacteriaceae bacterium]